MRLSAFNRLELTIYICRCMHACMGSGVCVSSLLPQRVWVWDIVVLRAHLEDVVRSPSHGLLFLSCPPFSSVRCSRSSALALSITSSPLLQLVVSPPPPPVLLLLSSSSPKDYFLFLSLPLPVAVHHYFGLTWLVASVLGFHRRPSPPSPSFPC